MSGLSRTKETNLRANMPNGLGDALIDRFTALEAAVTAANANANATATPPTNGNNNEPTFTAQSDWNKTVDGNVIALLTVPKVKGFFKDELSLANKHIHILRTEGIIHPIDLAQFDSEDCEAVIKSVKGLRVPLGGLSQILLKQACDFMQYLESTGREIKDAYLLRTVIKNHAIQFKAIKDLKTNKDGPTGLPKLGKHTDVLAWLDRIDKTLRKLTGQDHTPLAYLVRGFTVVPETLDDLIPDKCYSLTHKSLLEELVNRKSYSSLCVEADKVTLYDHLDKALSGGPLESVLQAHEETKDGQAVMESIMKQHGGKAKWEKSHAALLIASKRSWKSTGNITLTKHIASYRSIVS